MSQHNAQHAVHLAIRTIYVMTLEYTSYSQIHGVIYLLT